MKLTIPGVVAVLVFIILFVQWNMFTGSDPALVQQLENENVQLVKLFKEQQLQIASLKGSRPNVEAESIKNALKTQELTARITELERKLKSEKDTKLEAQDPKIPIFKKKLSEYAQLHRDIMSGVRPPRYAECVLINGWGNVLQEAVSCFLFAFASDRAVIFNTGAIDGYMPFQSSFDRSHMPFDGYNMKVIRSLPNEKKKTIPRFDLPCLDFSTVQDIELITIHLTYDWYAPNLLVNPYHGEDLLEILPETYFKIIFDYLWKLTPELQSEVDKFKAEYFKGYTVGIQIRNPTLDKTGKVDHKGFPVPPLYLFAQAAEQLARFQTEVPYEKTRFLMATQNIDHVKNLRDGYSADRIIFYNGTITTTFESNLEGQRVSLITWWLLGECDEVLTSEASSFGTTAAARSGHYPIVCTHHKYCFRRMSPTPCQDTPFLVEQPADCLTSIRKLPHQYLTAPDNSCGFYKHFIYSSPEHQQDSWNIK